MLDRRDFLKSAGLLTLGATMMPEVAMAKKPKKAKPGKKQIGFQAYSLGPELAGDNTAAGLKRLHDMGYTYVELAGFEGHSASELQKMAADAGIKVVSTHLNPNTNGEKYSSSNKQMIVDFWKKQIDEHAPFGMQYIVQPGLPRIDTIDDAKRVADVFNAAGEVAARAVPTASSRKSSLRRPTRRWWPSSWMSIGPSWDSRIPWSGSTVTRTASSCCTSRTVSSWASQE